MSQRYSAARNDKLDTRKYSALAAKLVHQEYSWLSDASLDHEDDEACDRVDTATTSALTPENKTWGF